MVRPPNIRSGAASNFFIYYEVDGDTSKHHLDVSSYGQENEWVLLVPAQ